MASYTGPVDPVTTSGKIFDTQEDLDKAWYAPNGGKLTVRNLNADSTHPNPWRPPTMWERTLPGRLELLNLTTWTQPTMKRMDVAFEKNSLTDNMITYGTKAVALGNLVAAGDLLYVKSSMALSPMGKVARWAYLVSPWLAMSTSYCATHHIVNKMVPERKNTPWTYAVSWVSPALVWGTYKRCWGAASRVAIFGGFFTYALKYFSDHGLIAAKPGSAAIFENNWTSLSPQNDPFTGSAKEESRHPNWWQTADKPAWLGRKVPEILDKQFDMEPSWKKHLPPEDRNKGPPVNS